MNVIGDVNNKICLLLDDIVDSGGTLCNAADALAEKGAKEIHAYITHGVLSGGAIEKISKSKLKTLVITDSIEPKDSTKKVKNIRIITISSLLGEAIRRISEESSVSSLFKF